MNSEFPDSPAQPPARPTRPEGAFELDSPVERPAMGSFGGSDFGDGGDLDFRYLLHVLWQKKWWVAAAGALGVALGVVLARQATPTYQTRSTIWVESGDNSKGPIQAEEVFEGKGWSDLFTSLAVVEPVVRQLDLHLDRESRGSDVLEGLEVGENVEGGRYRLSVGADDRFTLRNADDEIVDRGAVGDSVGEELGFRWAPTSADLQSVTDLTFTLQNPTRAAYEVRSNLQVGYDPRAGNLITARLTWEDPREAARILNETVQSFLDVAHDLKTKKLREVVSILERQTEYAQDRLVEAELALENARVENVTLPNEPNTSPVAGAQSSMDPVFQAYFQKRLRMDEIRSDLERLRSILDEQRATDSLDVLALRSVGAVGQSPELQQALETLSQKRAERRSLLMTYTEQHPDVQRMTEEIRILVEETIPAQIRQLSSQLQSELDRLNSNLQAQASELRDIPPRLIEEERLRREMQQAEQLHSDLLSRLKSAQLAASTSRPNLQVVDRAHPPGSPTSDQGPRLFLMASLAGFGIGIGGVLLHDRLDDRVRQPEDINTRLGLPVLGLVPRIPAGDKKGQDVAPAVLESFRSIRAQLTRSGGSGLVSVVITSPEPRDGKSLVSANLGISFASARRTTLLVDGDMRRGNAHQLFGVSPEPGLADYLNGEASLSEIIKATDVPGLVLIPRGNVRGFDPDRLEGPELSRLFDAVKQRFDVLLVDSPPLGAGPDALVFGEICDQALLVMRTGATDREAARARLEASMFFDFPVVGAVLNDVPDSAPYYRYYSPYRYYLEEGDVVA